MIFETRNIVSNNIKNTTKLIFKMLGVATKKKYQRMKITPFDDELLAKFGIFVEGYYHDIEDLLEEMRKLKIPFSDIPYTVRRKNFEQREKKENSK